jgi:hypothetical protein
MSQGISLFSYRYLVPRITICYPDIWVLDRIPIILMCNIISYLIREHIGSRKDHSDCRKALVISSHPAGASVPIPSGRVPGFRMLENGGSTKLVQRTRVSMLS